MLEIRPFRNYDPSKLVDIWNTAFSNGDESLVQISLDLLFESVLGKLFFDPMGLLIAFDDNKPVGFAHAAFGPNKTGTNVEEATGVISLILIRPSYPNAAELARLFVKRCEEYLVARGAKVIFGGSTQANASYYVGMYGGSEPLGVYNSEEFLINAYQEFGFTSINDTVRFRQDLCQCRPLFTPKSVVWRRKLEVKFSENFPIQTWFRACTSANFDWISASAILENQTEPLAKLSIRITRPHKTANLAVMAPTIAALTHVEVDPMYRQSGVGTFLIGESIRHLVSENRAFMIETVAPDVSGPFAALVRRVGWKEGERGQIFIKILSERRKQMREANETKMLAPKK